MSPRAAWLALALLAAGGAGAQERDDDDFPAEDAGFSTENVFPTTQGAFGEEDDWFPWKREKPGGRALAAAPPAAPSPPPPAATLVRTATEDARPAPRVRHDYPLPPPREPAVVAADLLAYERELEAAEPVVPPHRRQFYLALGGFAAHLAGLLDAAVEYDPPDEQFLRAVDVGHDVIGFALDFIVRFEANSAAVGVDLRAHVDGVLAPILWPVMRGILDDPRFATDSYDQVHDLLNRADAVKELTGKSLAAATFLHPGAQAASMASGAYGLAGFVGNLPSAVGALPGLSRVARWLGGAGAPTGTIGLAAGPGGPQFVVNAAAAVRVTPLVLTDAEVMALASSGAISVTAAQLYMVAAGGGGAAVGGAPGSGGFVSTQTGNTAKNASILKRNMKAKGVKFNPGDAAHHITPSTHPVANLARQILDEVGIDINQADNGIALDWTTHMKTGLHSKTGIQAVVERIQKYAGDREAILAVLKNIAEEIRAGSFPPKGP